MVSSLPAAFHSILRHTYSIHAACCVLNFVAPGLFLFAQHFLLHAMLAAKCMCCTCQLSLWSEYLTHSQISQHWSGRG